jgi:hypothetical protein
LTNSDSAVRKGSQRPRLESFPLYSTTAADDAIDLAAVAGLFLDPWQEYVLRGALGEKRNGKWSAFRCGLVVPRQNGKNALLEARELAGLFLFGEKRIIHTAHETKTARESMQSLMNRMKQSPDLMEQVLGFEGDLDKEFSGMKVGNDPSITLKGGAKISYAARSKGSGRGFTGDLIVMDEAYALKLDELAAMLPTMAAKSMEGNPQIWFTSSAGMPESDLLEAMRQEGIKKSSDRLAYFEWSSEDDAEIDDVESWYQANPGLGIRISEQFVRDELEAMVSESGSDEQFKRERLGIWAKLGGESVIDPKAWAAGLDESAPELPAVAFSLDVPPARDKADIVMVGFRADGEPFTELVERRVGISWAPSRLADLQRTHSPVAIVVDAASAAGALLPELKREGVKTLQLSPREYFQACGQVFDLIDQSKMHHSGQAEFAEATDAAQQKVLMGGLWKWTRGKDTLRDISPLVGLTLAWHGLSKRGRADKTKRKAVIL